MRDQYKNKVTWCPVCNQGWVEIVKEIDSEALFLYCNECETEWDEPILVRQKDTGHLGKFGPISDATDEEIHLQGWTDFLDHS